MKLATYVWPWCHYSMTPPNTQQFASKQDLCGFYCQGGPSRLTMDEHPIKFQSLKTQIIPLIYMYI